MSIIATPDDLVQRKLFHNEWINVYPMTRALDQIHFWPENNRTIFTFERLCRLRRKTLEELSLDEITQFVAEQDAHKLEVLADSIGGNGVQVPLIIRDDGKLLDGNRRYFACQWLKMQAARNDRAVPESLSRIPVFVIRKTDLEKSKTLELKILAEANFIPDLKIPWPLDAQARAVHQYYRQFQHEKAADHDAAVEEVAGVFGIKRQRVTDLLETLTLTKRFIAEGRRLDERLRRRAIVEEKFVYFWEFLNKAMKGQGAYTDPDELREVREMFFLLMARGISNPITNVKQVEPIVQSKRDRTAWSILTRSKGLKVNVVVSIMMEKREVRKAEDKIRAFLAWLATAEELTPKAKVLLGRLIELATNKSNE